MLTTFHRDEDVFLTWGHHDLASSLRTQGFEYPIFDLDGIQIDKMYSQKRAGKKLLLKNSVYLLRRYWTNSEYPQHTLYIIFPNDLEIRLEIDRYTEYQDVISSSIPKAIKDWIIDDIL